MIGTNERICEDMVFVCQGGPLLNPIRWGTLYIMCQVAAITDRPLAGDAPGVAHFRTMTALYGPVPKLIPFAVQNFHFWFFFASSGRVSALVSIARFSPVIDRRGIDTVFQDERVDNSPAVHASPAFMMEVRPSHIFPNQ